MDLINECLAVYTTIGQSARSLSDDLVAISNRDSRTFGEIMQQLPPREQVELSVILAYAMVTLYGVNLRCDGTDEKRHPIDRERERLLSYIAKSRPFAPESTHKRKLSIDHEAAVRVVKRNLNV